MSHKTPSVLDNYPHYETTIGIEVHVQLTTKSKIFCCCANAQSDLPNSNLCQICAGYPGVLPVLNEKVIECAIRAGLATNCVIALTSYFARKHYFYPDLPKNYQITQSDTPICSQGYVPIRLEDGSIKKIRLMRIHMEEDAGKNIHATHTNESFVDLNRTGTPLLEIVTYPDIASAYEARAYLKMLRSIVQYLGICSGNMEEGAFRADTNISVRKKGADKLGIRCELKNINSFKFIGDAIEYEIERQITLLESGGTVRQETRLWDTKNKETVVMRSKEEAADYRYLPDPDLPLILIDKATIDAVRQALPELPYQKFDRYTQSIGLTSYEAEILIDDITLACYFEDTLQAYISAKYNLTQGSHATPDQLKSGRGVVNWILRDVIGYLKEHKLPIEQFLVTPEKLAHLFILVENGTINNHAAKQVFAIIATTGDDPAQVVAREGFEQIGNTDELVAIMEKLLADYPKQVAEYKAGNQKLFGFFVGQAMQSTKGKGNPQVIQTILKKLL